MNLLDIGESKGEKMMEWTDRAPDELLQLYVVNILIMQHYEKGCYPAFQEIQVIGKLRMEQSLETFFLNSFDI